MKALFRESTYSDTFAPPCIRLVKWVLWQLQWTRGEENSASVWNPVAPSFQGKERSHTYIHCTYLTLENVFGIIYTVNVL